MLNAKENMLAVMKGTNPDRFVNQYEALTIFVDPYFMFTPAMPEKGGGELVNAWGITNVFPDNTPGSFPVHTPDKLVVKDIENWKEYVKPPELNFSNEQWDIFKAEYDKIDGEKTFKAIFINPGLFEQTHHLCSITEVLMNYIEYPDEMKEMIKVLTEWELKRAEGICDHLKPEMLFHHDDWGTESNSFLRPEMFAEFFVDAYKEIYGYWRSRGCEFITHHSDSYAANLVPYMIEMGIDIWQGTMESNNVPELVDKYGDKITFMGNIDNKDIDFDGWTPQDCKDAATRACDEIGLKQGYIPCITQGGPGSVFPGTYAELAKGIDEYNSKKFGFSQEELDNARNLPWQIMF